MIGMIDRNSSNVSVNVQNQNREFDYEKFGRAAADAMIAAGIKLMEQKKIFSTAKIMRVLYGRRFRQGLVLFPGMDHLDLTSFSLMKGEHQDGFHINRYIRTGEGAS